LAACTSADGLAGWGRQRAGKETDFHWLYPLETIKNSSSSIARNIKTIQLHSAETITSSEFKFRKRY